MFTAILLNKNDDGTTAAQVSRLDDAQLPSGGDVTVRVDYSTLNYKDGLAITGKAPVVRSWPMVPGIDGAGEVIASSHPDWKAGDAFILNGWGVGEAHWGCLSQRARLKGEWLVPRPPGMSARTAMAIGTAGYTAMLCATALQEQGVGADSGEILVTGASGGVGSIAIAILAGWGYRVVASTGKLDEADYLKSLGAAEVIDRAALSAPGKPLQKERWAGVVDSVGSVTLANAVAQTRYGGVVTACGLAQGMDFPGSVAPFILRSVRLIGIDSVKPPAAVSARERRANELDTNKFGDDYAGNRIGRGIRPCAGAARREVGGRLVVNLNA